MGVLVAHPDDETLWAGGIILSHPDWEWFIASLCRGSDPDRAPKFFRVLTEFNAHGRMADLDDSPDQPPISPEIIQHTILTLVGERQFDQIFTHGPQGEYTRHRRHEEVSAGVFALWEAGQLVAAELHRFAYGDQGRETMPQARLDADLVVDLDEVVWQKKYRLVTEFYGFSPQSWEARTTPRTEAFWSLTKS